MATDFGREVEHKIDLVIKDTRMSYESVTGHTNY